MCSGENAQTYAVHGIKAVVFYRSYHFVQELKADSPASETDIKSIGL